MNKILFMCFISQSFLAYSSEWKVIAKTSHCEEKIKILGKKGEKYVKAVLGNKELKLYHKDGDTFHKDSLSMKEYVSDTSSEGKYTFYQPGYVEANPAKISVTRSERIFRCQMESL